MHLPIAAQNRRHTLIVLASVAALLLFSLLGNNARYLSGGTLRQITLWSDEAGIAPLPHEKVKTPGASYEISSTLPAYLSDQDSLIFRTENLPVTVIVGGQTLLETALPGAHKTIGDMWHTVPLPEGAAGQTVTLRSMVLFSDGSNLISEVYLGEKADFLQSLLRRQIPNFIISLLLLLLGCALLASRLLLKRQQMMSTPLAFSMLSILLGVWTATQSEIPEMLWGQSQILLLITYGTLPFATMATCFFLRTLKAPQWLKMVYLWVGLSQAAEGIFAIAGEGFGFAAFVETLPYARMAMLLLLVLFMFQLPGLLKMHRDHFYLLTGFFCLVVMMVADLASVHAGVYDYAYHTRFGLLMMTMLVTLQSISQVRAGLRAADEADLMRRLAYLDPLTGLYNRLALVRDQEMMIAQKSGSVGIVQMDINSLKEVNDRYGHEEGDGLILRAATAIRAVFDSLGNSYRVGGDEFVSLLTNHPQTIAKESCREELSRACEEQNVNQRHPLSIAMGYALYDPQKQGNFYDLVRTADQRMYENKRKMKSTHLG